MEFGSDRSDMGIQRGYCRLPYRCFPSLHLGFEANGVSNSQTGNTLEFNKLRGSAGIIGQPMRKVRK
jgi:hypothetical protein